MFSKLWNSFKRRFGLREKNKPVDLPTIPPPPITNKLSNGGFVLSTHKIPDAVKRQVPQQSVVPDETRLQKKITKRYLYESKKPVQRSNYSEDVTTPLIINNITPYDDSSIESDNGARTSSDSYKDYSSEVPQNDVPDVSESFSSESTPSSSYW